MKQNAKYVPLVKQNVMKLEIFILGGQRIDQRRKKRLRKGEGENRDREHRHLSLLVVQLPQNIAFLLSSLSLQRSGLVKGLARRD